MKIYNIRLTAIEALRFWARIVEISDDDSCWLWKGKPNHNGYGRLTVNRRDERVHRIMYCLHYGPFDNERMVLHRCDNRLCVRPSHLFLGDAYENAKDRQKKGRTARWYGPQHHNSKLTAKQVRFIRKAVKQGKFTQRYLAKYFGVHESI